MTLFTFSVIVSRIFHSHHICHRILAVTFSHCNELIHWMQQTWLPWNPKVFFIEMSNVHLFISIRNSKLFTSYVCINRINFPQNCRCRIYQALTPDISPRFNVLWVCSSPSSSPPSSSTPTHQMNENSKRHDDDNDDSTSGVKPCGGYFCCR